MLCYYAFFTLSHNYLSQTLPVKVFWPCSAGLSRRPWTLRWLLVFKSFTVTAEKKSNNRAHTFTYPTICEDGDTST